MSYMNYNSTIFLDECKSFNERLYFSSNLDDSNSQFEECFSKIFVDSKLDDDVSEKEADCFNNKKSKKNSVNFDFSKEKTNPEVHSINSNENNSEKTDDKSKESSKKSGNQAEKDDFCELSSIDLADDSKNNNSINKVVNTIEENNCKIESDVNIIINQNCYTHENSLENNISFLGRKRRLFKVICPKDYAIFNYGDFNTNTRQTIDTIFNRLDEYGYKNLRINSNFALDDSLNLKKSHKRKKNLKKRKENSDNIRKKIKSRFFKILKNIINHKLKLAGSKEFFSNLSQAFISNISRDKNREVLDLTFKEIFSKNFCEDSKAKKAIESNIKKYKHNLNVLEYLENNQEIAEKSNYNIFKNMKFYQIFNEYLRSKEFEKEITSLKIGKENDKYIRNYIIKAGSFIEFYSQ